MWMGTPRGPLDVASILLDRRLHGERSVTRPHGMICVRDRRPEERHDAVAHDLVDRAFVAVDGGHHAFQDGIEELPGLLGIAVGE